jgi:hypothetical protein
MRNLTEIPAGEKLTAEESAAMIAASTLTGAARYGLHQTAEGWKVWDREDGEYVANLDGETVFSQRDAHDLRQEWIYS